MLTNTSVGAFCRGANSNRTEAKYEFKYYTKQKQNYKKFEVTLFSQRGRRPRCVNIILEVSTLVLHNIVWFANAFYPLTINLK